jgi:hypothetical protein
VFIATFSNISAISWRPVLVVEEAGVRIFDKMEQRPIEQSTKREIRRIGIVIM